VRVGCWPGAPSACAGAGAGAAVSNCASSAQPLARLRPAVRYSFEVLGDAPGLDRPAQSM
jgi:hypothetical protein